MSYILELSLRAGLHELRFGTVAEDRWPVNYNLYCRRGQPPGFYCREPSVLALDNAGQKNRRVSSSSVSSLNVSNCNFFCVCSSVHRQASILQKIRLHINDCERNDEWISVQENEDTIIKCSEFNNTCLEDGRHNVIWSITHANGSSVLLGICGCSACESITDGFLPQSQKTTSSLTIPSNYRILQNDTVQCSGDADDKSVSCNLRGVYLAKIESCSISSKGLSVNGSCNIGKVYASDGGYSCLWRKNGVENLITAMNLSEFTEKNGLQYYHGYCSFFLDTIATLVNETVTYSVSVTPGPGWSDVENITIAPPPNPPTITGYTEGQPILLGNTLTLTCTVTGGMPAVSSVTFFCGQHGDENDTTYENTDRSLVAVTSKVTVVNVSVADNGTNCSCKANWTPQQDLFQMVTSINLKVVDGQGSTLPHYTHTSSQDDVITTTNGISNQTTLSPITIPYTRNTFLQPSTTSTWTESSIIVNQSNLTTFSTKDTSNGDKASSKNSGGTTEVIIGGVIGALAFIIVVVVIVIFIKRRSGSADSPKRTQNTNSDDGKYEALRLPEVGLRSSYASFHVCNNGDVGSKAQSPDPEVAEYVNEISQSRQ